MNILIYNNYPAHYEIIESTMLQFSDVSNDNITIMALDNIYGKYISDKYNRVTITRQTKYDQIKYDKIIHITTYDKDISRINNVDNNKNIFICHEITDRLKKCHNTYFLTPLCNIERFFYCPILPYNNISCKKNMPIFIIQGNITNGRRNYNLLKKPYI